MVFHEDLDDFAEVLKKSITKFRELKHPKQKGEKHIP
jgi:hypothetical protein